MRTHHEERVIAWALALLSVALAWQLDLPRLLKSFAADLRVPSESALYYALVNGGIALIFVGISWSAVHFYEDVLWRWLPGLGCKRGWWIYGLIAEHGGTEVQIAGVFYLLHTPADAQVIEGRAFYVEGDSLRPRGNWSSDTVHIRDRRARVLYSMHSVNPEPEAIPSMYEGYLSLSRTSTRLQVGVESWRGYFHDLGDRREVAGAIYAERLQPLRIRHSDEAEKVLRKCTAGLLAHVNEGAEAGPQRGI